MLGVLGRFLLALRALFADRSPSEVEGVWGEVWARPRGGLLAREVSMEGSSSKSSAGGVIGSGGCAAAVGRYAVIDGAGVVKGEDTRGSRGSAVAAIMASQPAF